MSRFTSTVVNKVDRKGRVSVPATFRAALATQGEVACYVRMDWTLGCIEGYGDAYLDDVQARIDALDIGSEEREAFENAYFAESQRLQCDAEGRVVLPRELMASAGIEEGASFVGLNTRFQIWQPEAYAEHKRRQADVLRGRTLPKAGPKAGAARGAA